MLMWVDIPVGAMGQDVATVTATSAHDPAVMAAMHVTTRVNLVYMYLPFIAR